MPALQAAPEVRLRLQGVRRRGGQGARRQEADRDPAGPEAAQVGQVQVQLPASPQVAPHLSGHPGPQGAREGKGIRIQMTNFPYYSTRYRI